MSSQPTLSGDALDAAVDDFADRFPEPDCPDLFLCGQCGGTFPADADHDCPAGRAF